MLADIPAPWDYIFAAAALVLLGAAAVGLFFLRRLIGAVEFLKSLLDDLVVSSAAAEALRKEWEHSEPE